MRFDVGRFIKSLLRTTAAATEAGEIGHGDTTAKIGAGVGAVMDMAEDAAERKRCPHCGKEI